MCQEAIQVLEKVFALAMNGNQVALFQFLESEKTSPKKWKSSLYRYFVMG